MRVSENITIGTHRHRPGPHRHPSFFPIVSEHTVFNEPAPFEIIKMNVEANISHCFFFKLILQLREQLMIDNYGINQRLSLGICC
jgi:hypothetical protein